MIAQPEAVSTAAEAGQFHLKLRFSPAIHSVPELVRTYGLREAHAFPHVARRDDWRVTRRPVDIAWSDWPEIELRTPNSHPALILDCDTLPEVYLGVARGGDLPAPNWIVPRGWRGHAHVVYCLERPVLWGEGMKRTPLGMLARVMEFFRWRYGADVSYGGLLTHNPVHVDYARYTSWGVRQPYSLTRLLEAVPRGWRSPKQPTTIEGRNVLLFRRGMEWCGRPANWDWIDGVGVVLGHVNDGFQNPLPESELRHIVKSVVQISRRNLESGRTRSTFSRLQSERARQGRRRVRMLNRPRNELIVRERRSGVSARAVAKLAGVSPRTVGRVMGEAARSKKESDSGQAEMFTPQRVGGLRSGRVRAAAAAARDPEVGRLVEGGLSVRGVARKLGIGVQTAARALRRWQAGEAL